MRERERERETEREREKSPAPVAPRSSGGVVAIFVQLLVDQKLIYKFKTLRVTAIRISLSLCIPIPISLSLSLHLCDSLSPSLSLSLSLSVFPSLCLFLSFSFQLYRQVGLEIVDQAALDVSNEAVVHVLHFKTFTECNPPHTLSPATALDESDWGVRYDLSVTQLIEAMCRPSVWKKSLIINLTLLEGHANAGRFVHCPFCSITTCG